MPTLFGQTSEPVTQRDPRRDEADLIEICRRLRDGHLPSVPDNAVEARRLGYLAEFTALLLGASNRRRLLAYAASCRARSAGDATVFDLHTLAPVTTGSVHDDLARDWGVGEGLDRARVLSELTAMDALSSRPCSTQPAPAARPSPRWPVA